MKLTVLRVNKLILSILCRVELFCFLVLLPGRTRGECLPNPNQRESYFMACSIDSQYNYNITATSNVYSALTCGSLCLADSDCQTFNVVEKGSGDLMCQLSRDQINDCSTVDYMARATAYTVRHLDGLCSDTWKVVLVTEQDLVLNGSVRELQDSVISGAEVRILWEPYPQSPNEQNYKGIIYVVDSLKVQDSTPYVTANIYTYSQETMNDEPIWMYVKIDSSGNLETTLSTGVKKSYVSNTITWMVRRVSSECYQGVALTVKGPVGKPAYVIEETDRTGELIDLITVIEKGSTARVVSHYGSDGTLAYPTFMMYWKRLKDLLSAATWLPGKESHGEVLPLRAHRFNYSGAVVEMFVEFQTDGSPIDGYAKDPALTKTELFLDPCWEAVWSADKYSGDLIGSREAFIAALKTGARIFFVATFNSDQLGYECERIEFYSSNNTYAAYSKMGFTMDNGKSWTVVKVLDTPSDVYIGTSDIQGSAVTFYTDRRKRTYRYKLESGSEAEGTWEETRARLKSGQIPRALIEISSGQFYLLGVETVRVAHDYYNVYLQSYREPGQDGLRVYLFSLDQYIRLDEGRYRGSGNNIIPAYTFFESLTLFFED